MAVNAGGHLNNLAACLDWTVPMPEPGDVVRSGYEEAAARYGARRDQFQSERYLRRFTELLPPPAHVLDVGCGSGEPVDRYLIDHGYTVIGIDFSHSQIDLARHRVPEARYEMKDMLELHAGEYRVDGVVSFYAIFHTPRDRHAELLETVASFLRPGGVMLITMGGREWEGTA